MTSEPVENAWTCKVSRHRRTGYSIVGMFKIKTST